MREWKMRYGQNCKGGKCRSKSYGTPTQDYIEKTSSSYFVGLGLILLTE